MKLLHRTNNPVELSWLESLLLDHNIPCAIMDRQTGNLWQGMFNAYARVMVSEDDFDAAKRVFDEAKAAL